MLEPAATRYGRKTVVMPGAPPGSQKTLGTCVVVPPSLDSVNMPRLVEFWPEEMIWTSIPIQSAPVVPRTTYDPTALAVPDGIDAASPAVSQPSGSKV